MATYAAYRHIELDNIGYGKKRVLKPPGGGSSDIFGTGSEQGGGNEPRRGRNQQQSTLFLGSDDDHHSANGKSSNKPGNDSHQRLFGDGQLSRTPSVKSNRTSSNIVLEAVDTRDENQPLSPKYKISNNIFYSDDNAKPTVLVNGNCSTSTSSSAASSTCSTPVNGNSPRGAKSPRLYSPRNPVTGDGYGLVPARVFNSYGRRKDGNPVTGEGYDTAPPKPQTPQLSNGGSTGPSTPNTAAPAAPRQRVPPGGFSSGLW